MSHFEVITFTPSDPLAGVNGGNLASEVDPGIFLPPVHLSAEVFDPKSGRTIIISRGDTVLEILDIEWAVGSRPPSTQEIMSALASDVDIIPVSARYLTTFPIAARSFQSRPFPHFR